jgi:hypothetical protein
MSNTDRLDKVLAQREPEQTKALLRILITASRKRQDRHPADLPHRRARVCAASEKVETVGIEPTQRSRREED